MKEEFQNQEDIEEVNDETPDNFTRYGNGHKEKVRKRYTDGEPPHEDEEEDANPDEPYQEIPKKKYP